MPAFRTSVRTSMLTEVVNDMGTSAVIRVYGGTPPATIGDALSGNPLLVTLTGNASQFGTVSGAVLTVSAITSGTAAASGTPTFARGFKSDGTTLVAQFTAGVGSGELNFNATIRRGQTVALSSFTITEEND